ncbi:hypothetical protein TRIUR3_08291 [Triticum urartu]|uniref:Uncharacterized protein n=1 Tax=Triticum urartu TaxID=4572 RepID=M7YJ71_TRIUA|nr:hypothetical protein TRIUR3_08291 [Triticum urartu]
MAVTAATATTTTSPPDRIGRNQSGHIALTADVRVAASAAAGTSNLCSRLMLQPLLHQHLCSRFMVFLDRAAGTSHLRAPAVAATISGRHRQLS